MGRIINAEFGSDDDEVLMWTEFGASLTVWDLRTGKSIEIRDPKFHNSCDINNGEEGYGSAYKPVRQNFNEEDDWPRDILSIHAAQTYEVISSATLPSIDAKGLKWSPDGRWLTIWEAPSQGMRIWIYTADGHLFRSYTPNNAKDLEVAELGICSLEWSPSGEWLALGGFERRVTLLNTRTPIKRISWAPNRPSLLLIQCRLPDPVVYLWDAEGLPAAPDATENLDTATAPGIEEDITRRVEAPPQILHLPLDKRGASSTARRLEATWLPRRTTQVPAFVFGDSASFIIVRPRGSDPDPVAEEDDSTTQGPGTDLDSHGNRLSRQRVHVEATQSGGSSASSRPITPRDDESEDSLYEILTGRSPVRGHPIHGRYEEDDNGETMQIAEMVDAEEGEDDFTRMEDTFAGKKGMSFSDD
ncbi:MAG: hypothetical protein Q9157_008114, partial [Trypethelium eluteriae]